jgi:hypothetical protein
MYGPLGFDCPQKQNWWPQRKKKIHKRERKQQRKMKLHGQKKKQHQPMHNRSVSDVPIVKPKRSTFLNKKYKKTYHSFAHPNSHSLVLKSIKHRPETTSAVKNQGNKK